MTRDDDDEPCQYRLIVTVNLWNQTVGSLTWAVGSKAASFEYADDFRRGSLAVAPLKMPLSDTQYSFPTLPYETFYGLPGMLADSLPDKFGTTLVDDWFLPTAGRLSSAQRLCLVGNNGMGALTFIPETVEAWEANESVELNHLVNIVIAALQNSNAFNKVCTDPKQRKLAEQLVRLGMSVGGSRPKLNVLWNPHSNTLVLNDSDETNKNGFECWLLKIDGITSQIVDNHLAYRTGFGLIEYAYYKLALSAGIRMSESRVFQENGRNHFMTKRFDRTATGDRLHMQSLCAIAHYDFNSTKYAYEQVFEAMSLLNLSQDSQEEQFRRMAFNLVARNQDDHAKNIAFLMDKSGRWSLSPAFDVTYAYNPLGLWTNKHQMSVNGKRACFSSKDIYSCADTAAVSRKRAKEIFLEVQEAISQWSEIARDVGVPPNRIKEIAMTHCTLF